VDSDTSQRDGRDVGDVTILLILAIFGRGLCSWVSFSRNFDWVSIFSFKFFLNLLHYRSIVESCYTKPKNVETSHRCALYIKAWHGQYIFCMQKGFGIFGMDHIKRLPTKIWVFYDIFTTKNVDWLIYRILFLENVL